MLDLSWKRWQEMLSFNRAGGSSGIIITVLLRWLIRTTPWAYFSHIIVSVVAWKVQVTTNKKKTTRSNVIGQRLFIWDYHARLCIDSCSVTYLPSTDIFQTLSEVSRAKLRSTSKGDKWISAKMKLWAHSPCFWTYDGLPSSPWPIDSGPQVISLPSHSVIRVCHSSLWLAWL